MTAADHANIDPLAIVREIIEGECVRNDADVEALRALVAQAEASGAELDRLRQLTQGGNCIRDEHGMSPCESLRADNTRLRDQHESLMADIIRLREALEAGRNYLRKISDPMCPPAIRQVALDEFDELARRACDWRQA